MQAVWYKHFGPAGECLQLGEWDTPSPGHGEVKASALPIFAHLALVLIAGLFLPSHLVAWFQSVAKALG